MTVLSMARRIAPFSLLAGLMLSSCGLKTPASVESKTPADGTSDRVEQLPIRLTDLGSDQLAPAFSPDGQSLIYQSNGDGNWELYTLSLEDLRFTRLTDTPEGEEDPSWSSDGKWVLATVTPPSTSETPPRDIVLISADAKERRKLASHASDDWFPSFATDGQSILFVSDRADTRKNVNDNERLSAIYRVATTGQALEQITGGDDESMPIEYQAVTQTEDGEGVTGLQDIAYRDAQGVIRTHAGNKALLPSSEWNLGQGIAAPNGHLILVGENSELGRHLFHWNGLKLEILHTVGDAQMHPVLSPDRTRIAYAAKIEGQWDLFIQDAPTW
jgi:Tol biopolymer transport system component